MSIEDEIRVVRIGSIEESAKKWGSSRFFTHASLLVLKAINMTPPILHVNGESRLEGLKVYKPVFGTRLQHPVYFNFTKDFLVFDGGNAPRRFELFMDLHGEIHEK
jgi:2EXR family